MERRDSTDLAVVIAVTVATVVLTLVTPGEVAALMILTLPLVLVLPGYAITSAGFPQPSRAVPECLLLSLGLSLGVVALSGLVLNVTPWGLRTGSWVVLLGSITLIASVIALWRRQRYPLTTLGRFSPGFGPRLAIRRGILIGLAMLVAAGAIGVARMGASRQDTKEFTQLWLLPAGESNQDTARLGVRNVESAALGYRLQLTVAGDVYREWLLPELQPGESWETLVIVPRSAAWPGRPVEGLLYRTDAPETIYRRVVLWPNTTATVDGRGGREVGRRGESRTVARVA